MNSKRGMNHRQATHMFLCCFGVLGKEPPGGTLPAARRRLGFTLVSGFADEAPGGTG